MNKLNDIIITEKPNTVSWDEIHEVLWTAHAKNREKGMYMRYPSLSGEELKNLIGEKGKCFVAMCDGKVIGTNAYILKKNNRWYAKGQIVAHFCLASILPDYQGSTAYFSLIRYRQRYIDKLGIKIVDMDTAEDNKMVQKLLLKLGYKYVDYIASKSPHYSVVMARWQDGCPFSDKYCAFRFWIRKIKVRLRYKPGKIKRFI